MGTFVVKVIPGWIAFFFKQDKWGLYDEEGTFIEEVTQDEGLRLIQQQVEADERLRGTSVNNPRVYLKY